jgi:hypothetical protein
VIIVGCDERVRGFLDDLVAPTFYDRSGERLRVVREGTEGAGAADFVVLAKSSYRTNPQAWQGVKSLNGYKTYLSLCGANVGSFTLADSGLVLMKPSVPSSLELPEDLEFLTLSEAFVLAVRNPKMFARRGSEKFFYLSDMRRAIMFHLPLVPTRQAQHLIHVGKTSSVERGRGRGQSRSRHKEDRAAVDVRTVRFDPRRKPISFDLTVENISESPIRALEAYFFEQPTSAFPNAHGLVELESRVNKIGPIAGYHFGDLAVGDSITRRVQYDTSFGSTIPTAWTTYLIKDGFGDGGSGCSTTKPGGLSGDGGIVMASGSCYNDDCIGTHGT